jgi:hypothetical protein
MKDMLLHLAQTIKVGDSTADIGYDGIGSDQEALANILSLVYTWAAVIAVIVIIVAGLFFVTSRGDAAQIKRSKDAIRGAVIGLIVVFVAFVITRFVIGGAQG